MPGTFCLCDYCPSPQVIYCFVTIPQNLGTKTANIYHFHFYGSGIWVQLIWVLLLKAFPKSELGLSAGRSHVKAPPGRLYSKHTLVTTGRCQILAAVGQRHQLLVTRATPQGSSQHGSQLPSQRACERMRGDPQDTRSSLFLAIQWWTSQPLMFH